MCFYGLRIGVMVLVAQRFWSYETDVCIVHKRKFLINALMIIKIGFC